MGRIVLFIGWDFVFGVIFFALLLWLNNGELTGDVILSVEGFFIGAVVSAVVVEITRLNHHV